MASFAQLASPSFALRRELDTENIGTILKDGVLRVELSKAVHRRGGAI